MLFTLFPWLCIALVSENERKYTTVAADAFNLPPHSIPNSFSHPLLSPFKAGKWSCAGASDRAQLAWGAVQCGELEMQDSDRGLSTANTNQFSSLYTPACLQACPVPRPEPRENTPRKGWGILCIQTQPNVLFWSRRMLVFLGEVQGGNLGYTHCLITIRILAEKQSLLSKPYTEAASSS